MRTRSIPLHVVHGRRPHASCLSLGSRNSMLAHRIQSRESAPLDLRAAQAFRVHPTLSITRHASLQLSRRPP